MNLGYLKVPQQRTAGPVSCAAGRVELASELGFSEFYTVGPQDLNGASPEHADVLRTLPEQPKKPAPQIVAINGQRQSPNDAKSNLNLARPSVTPEQVAANAHHRQATLSVSWLNKTELARHWAAHVTGSTHAGLRARAEDWRIARTIVVCSDAARAEAAVKSNDSPCRAYYADIAQSQGLDVDALMKACVLYGSLQSVLDRLDDIAATSGPFGTLTLVDHDWPDATLAEHSMAALASALAPVMQRTRASN